MIRNCQSGGLNWNSKSGIHSIFGQQFSILAHALNFSSTLQHVRGALSNVLTSSSLIQSIIGAFLDLELPFDSFSGKKASVRLFEILLAISLLDYLFKFREVFVRPIATGKKKAADEGWIWKFGHVNFYTWPRFFNPFRREQFLQWTEALPDAQSPSWLGLPNNAEKVLLTTQGIFS